MVRSVNVYSLEDFIVRFGDEALAWNLERFSCPLNVKVEEFLKNKAVHSSRLGASVTYLVVNNETSEQKLVGGKMVLVDRELDRPKLLDFYKGNNFRSWNVRHSKKDGMDYDQMICVLKSA